MPRVGVSLSRYFLGALSEERLTLNGPYGFGSGGVPALSVQGTVTASAGEGTLIRLSVRPAAAILGMALLCASGIIAGGLFAILDQVIVFPVGLFTAFCMLGVVFYAVARLSAVHRLNELLECLENLLKARRRT